MLRDFGSGTDPIAPLILLFFLLGRRLWNKSLRLRRFKPDPDEICQDCSLINYTSIDGVRFLI